MNVYQVITDRILSSLSNGVVPWRCPWHTEPPKNLISGKDYRGVNVLLLQASPFESPYWLTFNQARDLGGTVKKGERGTPVVYFKVYGDDDAKAQSEQERRRFVLRYYTVFNVAQTEGIEAPASPSRPAFNPIQECERVVSAYRDPPRIEHGGGQACYLPSRDRVQMPARESFNSVPEYYSTLFHELTHSTGAAHRLARKGVVDPIRFSSHDYSFEELVAECGAAFLCGHAGISAQVIDNSASYISCWARKLRSEPRWIVEAAGQAAKAADLILDKQARTSVDREAA
jgi:antirestriction protein ArdC